MARLASGLTWLILYLLLFAVLTATFYLALAALHGAWVWATRGPE